MKLFLGILGRYALVWAINVLALILSASILPGFRFDTTIPHWWLVALTLPVEFALLLILLRPLLVLLTFPLNSLTLGLPTLLFNGIILYTVSQFESSLVIDSLLHALVGLTVLTIISTSLVGWLGIDETYPFFQSVLYRIGRRFGPRRPEQIKRGLLILQVDGLSYTSCLRALERGRMPTLSGLLVRASHRLYRYHSGLPSNTPAVQGGFMYGSRHDVVGYRWFDRAEGRVRAASSPRDLREIEAKVSAGVEGLLAGGSCINSFLSGGAAKRLMTLSAQQDPENGRRKGELADFNFFWLSPFAYTKAMLASVWDLGTGMFWGVVGRLFHRRPRLKFDPRRLAMRAVANAFLRETSQFWIKQDLVRGVPVIYSNFVGYDEVAHYCAPDAYEAQISLSAFDRTVRRLLRLMRSSSPIAYEVVVMSDHGQVTSVPFRHLYGRELELVVAEYAGLSPPPPEQTPISTLYITALLEELRASQAAHLAWTAKRSSRTLERLRAAREPAVRDEGKEAVHVCVSGCLAHVYFEGFNRRLDLEDLVAEFPGLVEKLASHPGIGFVAARQEDGQVVVLGADGLGNLDTGEVRGESHPLAVFGDLGRHAGEVRRLVDCPSAGDLVVNGTWDPVEGHVVVFEEQTSSHGGLGGPQTEPFFMAPSAWGTGPGDLETPESLHRHLQQVVRDLRAGR